jgi:hypothetical protein
MGSEVHPLATGAAEVLQKNLLAHALSLNDDIFQPHFGFVHLEVVLLGLQIIGAQNVDLHIFAQTTKDLAVILTHRAHIIKGEFTSPSLERSFIRLVL